MEPDDRAGPGTALLAFAEDPDEFLILGPDEERVVSERYVATFVPGEHYWSTSVGRLRFDDGGVAAGVEEVRALMHPRGRRAAVWTVGPSATPRDVREQLVALGLEAEGDEPDEIVLLTEAPSVRPTAFAVRRVSTFDEHLDAIEVANEGFAFTEHDAEDERRRARMTFDAEQTGGNFVRFAAFDGDRAVASAYVAASRLGLYLGGAATIASHRGRGAMSAIVAAAWSEAIRRGTPAIVAYAGTCHGRRSGGSGSNVSATWIT